MAHTRLDINTCSQRDLQTLPGIGPKKADAIVSHRIYTKVADLLSVPSIGRITFAGIKELVRVIPPILIVHPPPPPPPPPPQALLLPALKSNQLNEYRIAMMPINSTGDCYHVLAYLLLCRGGGDKGVGVPRASYHIPAVDWFFDANNVKMAAQRCHSFMLDFGFTSTIQEKLHHKVARSCARQDAVHKFYQHQCDNTKATIRYIDIKALTILLASVWTDDVSRAIIRAGFVAPVNAAADAWVKAEMKRIENYRKTANMVVLHARFSHNSANPGQDVPDEFWEALHRYLTVERGLKVWLIIATSKPASSIKRINSFGTSISEPFVTPALRGGDAAAPTDFSKHGHLRLLHALAEQDGVLGIIGNTSGTLDAAAFVGARVLNLHTLGKLDYQATRIFAQASLLDVQVLRLGIGELKIMTEMAKKRRGVYRQPNQTYVLDGRLLARDLVVCAQWLDGQPSPLSCHTLTNDEITTLRTLYDRDQLWGVDQLACVKIFLPDSEANFHKVILPAFSSFKTQYLFKHYQVPQ